MTDNSENSTQILPSSPVTAEEIRLQLAQILASKRLHRSRALKALLQFVVEETLAGRDGRLKARSIAVQALGRPKDFDSRSDPIVSIQAGRLRRALERYYEEEGQDDPIEIHLPAGRYTPTFTPRNVASVPSADPDPPAVAVSGDVGAPSVAVCQFGNLSGDPAQSYFAAGITQEIVTELTRFQELHILACQNPSCAAAAADGRGCDCEMGARFALRGATRRSAESVRITAQLVDTLSSRQVWAKRFDRELSALELFDVQDEVARSVAATVADNYGVISRTLAREVRCKPPTEFRSYEAVLRFRHYQFEVSDQSRQAAIDALEQAVQRDPEYALAWAMLSETTVDAYGLRIDSSPQVIARAKEQARRALALDPECQHAHWSMVLSHLHERDREALIREAEETIALNPNNGYLVGASAWAMALAGEWERGLVLLRRSTAGNPHYPTWFNLAPFLDHYRRGECAEALVHAEQFNTELAWDLILRAAALGQLGRNEDAKAVIAQLEARFPNVAADPAHYLRGYIFIDDLVVKVLDGLRKAGWNRTAKGSSSPTA